jgi:hypothetical protein
VQKMLRAALKQYLGFIEKDDWPAMAQGRASLRRTPPGLTDGMSHRSLSTSPSRTTLAASDPGVDHPQIPVFLDRNRQDDAVRPEI